MFVTHYVTGMLGVHATTLVMLKLVHVMVHAITLHVLVKVPAIVKHVRHVMGLVIANHALAI